MPNSIWDVFYERGVIAYQIGMKRKSPYTGQAGEHWLNGYDQAKELDQ